MSLWCFHGVVLWFVFFGLLLVGLLPVQGICGVPGGSRAGVCREKFVFICGRLKCGWLPGCCRRRHLHGGVGLEATLLAPGALLVAVVDARFEFDDQLLQRGAQRVIHGFREDIRPRRDEMRRDAERRARLETVLDEHAGLVDLQRLAERFDLLGDERGEGVGRLMMTMLNEEFHNAPTLPAN